MKGLVVLSTFPTRASAQKAAEVLVRKKLARCVQVSGPLESFYRWKGKLESSREFQLSAKLIPAQYGPLERELRKLHPYDTPQIIALPITRGLKNYLDWLKAS